MPELTFPVIPSKALIDIQISGSFYRRLLMISVHLAEQKSIEEYKKVLEKIKDNKPESDPYEIQVHAIMMLIYEIETKAKDQGKTELKTVDTDKPETFIES